MNAPALRFPKVVVAAAWVAATLAASAAPARAQDTRTDPRWQGWLGCWQPIASASGEHAGARALLVCIVPASGSTGVDVATVADTQVVSRERLEATGAHRPATRDNCSGWESTEWSALGERVYLHSELTCQGNFVRRSSGLMAFSPEGEWLDVRSVTAGTHTGVRVLRYRAAPLPESLPADIASALRLRGDLGISPALGGADLTLADVADASRQLDAGVVSAWLAETDQDFAMDGTKLLAAQRAGIPGGVTDLMVALSYPRVFTVNPASRQVALRPAEPRAPGSEGYGYGPSYGYAWGGSYYSPFGWDTWWPYGYNPYSPFFSPYGGYGYAMGYGYGGGWFYSGGGVIISTGGGAGSHGQFVKGRGYTQGGAGGGSGRDAKPRESPSTRSEGRRSTGSSAQPSSGGRSQPSSSGSSGSSGRTAKPRSPGR